MVTLDEHVARYLVATRPAFARTAVGLEVTPLTCADGRAPFADVAVYVVRQRFWQYACVTAVLLEHRGATYVFAPRVPSAPLASLPVYRTDGRRIAALVDAVRDAATGFRAALLPPPDDDLAPHVVADLARDVATGREAHVLDVLDRLAAHAGEGSTELDPREVSVGAAAEARLRAIASALERRVLLGAAMRLQGGDPQRATGLIVRYKTLDGYVGGFERETLVGTLEVARGAFRYERDVLFHEREEGDPMT